MKRRIFAAVLLSSSALAWAGAVDQKFPDDFYQSKPLTDAAMKEVPDGIKLLLSSFLLRVRWCDTEQKKWIHRGLTIKEAILLEKRLQDAEGPFDPKSPRLVCL